MEKLTFLNDNKVFFKPIHRFFLHHTTDKMTVQKIILARVNAVSISFFDIVKYYVRQLTENIICKHFESYMIKYNFSHCIE